MRFAADSSKFIKNERENNGLRWNATRVAVKCRGDAIAVEKGFRDSIWYNNFKNISLISFSNSRIEKLKVKKTLNKLSPASFNSNQTLFENRT